MELDVVGLLETDLHVSIRRMRSVHLTCADQFPVL